MTYSPECIDKNLPRGNSRNYLGTVREPKTGAVPIPPAIDLTDKTIIFEMKKCPEPRRLCPTDEVVVRKTSDDANEIEILDQLVPATKGQYRLKLVPADTQFLAPGVYAYSIDVLTATGQRYTVTTGRFNLKGPATAAENLTPPC
jgi:hypothetical protein